MKQNLPSRNKGAEQMEEQIRQALSRQAETVRVSSQDSQRMIRSVHRKIEEENRMRKWSAKKIVVVAAAVCVFGTITAVAAGKIAGIASYSSWNDAVYQYSKVADMEKEVGFEAKIPEAFANGYGFTSDDAPLTGDSTFTHGDCTLYFSVRENLFVPPDYQVSEEEQALSDAGKLNIGYGTSEVQRNRSQTIYWEDGGVFYTIISFDNTMTAEEFAGMAGEIIDLK